MTTTNGSELGHRRRRFQVAFAVAVALILAGAGSAAPAADFSARLGVGLENFNADELVYLDGAKLSELNWSADNVPTLNIGLSVRPVKWVKLNLDFGGDLQSSGGSMTDTDWFIQGMPWTDRSEHPNTELERAQWLDISAEMAFWQWGRTLFLGSLGYRWDSLQWAASGGSYIYSEYGFRDTTGTLPNVLGVSYDQNFEAPYLSLRVRHDWNKWSLNGRAMWSPFVQARAKDIHHLRALQFNDTFDDTNMYGFGVSVIYHVKQSWEIAGSFEYSKIEEASGKTTYVDLYSNQAFGGDARAGTSLDSTSFGLSVSYYF